MGKGDDRTASAMRPLASVFMHADATDAVLMALGLLGAMGDGLSTPVMLYHQPHLQRPRRRTGPSH
jgi:hypothetical protein